MKKIVRFLSLIILIVAIGAISWLTVYTLNHKGMREDVKKKVTKSVEKITTNMGNNILSEIYNVYINGLKHKVKFDYNVSINESGISKIELVAYFDGKSILDEVVANNMEATDIDALFENDNIKNFVRLNERDIQIIKSDNIEYFVINVGYFDTYFKEKYFVFNDKPDKLNDKELLVRDSSKYYIDIEDNELDIFYGEEQLLGKIEGNAIYTLVAVENKKSLNIQEYKYSIVDGNLKEELVNTYVDIKIKDTANNE